MSSTGRVSDRIDGDAYYTPDTLARALVGTLGLLPGATVWEPHAGGGAFVRALVAVGAFVSASDLNPEAAGLEVSGCGPTFVGDFLKYRAEDDVENCRPSWVAGNPPFTDAEAHVRQALAYADVGVAFLLRLAFLEGKGRIPFWREHPAARVYVLAERPSFTGGKTDSCAYGWFVWDKRHVGPTQLHALSWR